MIERYNDSSISNYWIWGRLRSVPFFVCLIIQSYVYSKNYNYDIIKYGYNLREHIEVLYIENK